MDMNTQDEVFVHVESDNSQASVVPKAVWTGLNF